MNFPNRFLTRSPVPLKDMAASDKEVLVDEEPKTKWYTFARPINEDTEARLRDCLPRSLESSIRFKKPMGLQHSRGAGAFATHSADDILGRRTPMRSFSPADFLGSQLPSIRTRADSVHYFGEHSVRANVDPAHNLQDDKSTLHNVEVRGYNIKQSQRLPYWIWFVVAKSLGIKLSPGDRPWFGTLLFVLTLLFALTSVLSTSWYLVYDVVNQNTRQTVLTGSTLGLLAVYWCSMSIYANKLAYRLLTNTKMLMSVRMHSKTIFKMNTVFLLSLLGLAFMILNNYQNVHEFYDSTCSSLYLPPIICKLRYLSRVGVSIFGLIWNLLVGNVVLSVCRTHTIGIRRFIRELELDGLMYVQHCRDLHHGHGKFDDVMHNFETAELPHEDDIMDDLDESWQYSSRRMSRQSYGWTPFHQSTSASFLRSTGHRSSGEGSHEQNKAGDTKTSVAAGANVAAAEPASSSGSMPDVQELKTIARPSFDDDNCDKEIKDEQDVEHEYIERDEEKGMEDVAKPVVWQTLFTTEDILLSYHQIMVRLRTTSRSLQRWMASWVALITLWAVLFVIYWINHSATFFGIAEFIIPLFILPLICSAYAEVNFEGKRLLKVYDTAISFSSIVTVIAAVCLALLTRIMLSELDIK